MADTSIVARYPECTEGWCHGTIRRDMEDRGGVVALLGRVGAVRGPDARPGAAVAPRRPVRDVRGRRTVAVARGPSDNERCRDDRSEPPGRQTDDRGAAGAWGPPIPDQPG